MEDEELQAIRRARMQQIRGSGAGGGPGAGGDGPSGSFLDSIGAGGKGGGSDRQGSGAGGDEEQQQKMAQMDEQRRQMLSTILDNDARERCECTEAYRARQMLAYIHC